MVGHSELVLGLKALPIWPISVTNTAWFPGSGAASLRKPTGLGKVSARTDLLPELSTFQTFVTSVTIRWSATKAIPLGSFMPPTKVDTLVPSTTFTSPSSAMPSPFCTDT